MPVNEQVVDSITIDNVKVVAGGTAAALVGHINRLNLLAEAELGNSISFGRAVAGKVIEGIQQMDAVDAMANAVIGQQGTKVAQSTPPQTAVPTTP